MVEKIAGLLKWSNKEIPSRGMAIFRIVFGLIMTWEMLYFYRVGFLNNFIFGPKTLFNYDFLPMVPLDRWPMEMLLAGLLGSCILITLGYFYRLAIIYFFIVFTYFFLLDKGIYNNHLYLISLLSFLLIFINADADLSLTKKRQNPFIPQWQYRILQF